ESRFVTLWVGVFDASTQTLRYVDAGHSYATLKHPDGTFTSLDAGGGFPIGIATDSSYQTETIALPPGGTVTIVSDGIIEQRDANSGIGAATSYFDMAGVRRSLAASTSAA